MNPIRSTALLLSLLLTTAMAQTHSPAAAAPPAGHAAAPLELKSPDGNVVLRFQLKTLGKDKGCPVYDVTYAGTPVLVDSRLGLQLRNGRVGRDLEIIGQQASASDTTWHPLAGERDCIRDHYNQLVVELRGKGDAWRARRLTLTFRAYDEGVAFQYTLPRENNGLYFDILGEDTQFAFAGDFPAWAVYAAQADYTGSQTTLSKVLPGAERPLTVRVADHLYASVTEARIAESARMKLRHADGTKGTLEVFLDAERAFAGEVTGRTPFTTPWRVVMMADSPGKLLEHNYLVLNLNDSCAITDTFWIKPGKVIRDCSLTTAGGKACVDFTARHHMQYVEFDAGWYGPEADPRSDAREVTPTRRSSLDLHEVIDYGRARGIGVILYVNHIAMEQQLDEILPLYEQWGVKGVKYGFVNVGSRFWTALTHEAIRKAAAHHLMVDIHDEFRNCGYERTYPNLMTVEGIGGDETRPTPVHNAILPFTRFLTGPADHTFCWNAKNFPNLKGHQLAIATIFYSPWQFLYWYDSPKGIPDEPALEYWDRLPATWNETRVLQGDIGRRVVVARRQGDEWFVGAIAPVDGKFPIALDFLPPGKKFTAKIFSDRPDKSGVQVEEQTVDNSSVLNADIPQNGGLAVWLASPQTGKR
jgi:alpha-glucosidase